MAKSISLDLRFGFTDEVYLRFNNFESFTKEEAVARFRAFKSREAFLAKQEFMHEFTFTFVPPDPLGNVIKQAYEALGSYSPKAGAEAHANDLHLALDIEADKLAAAKAALAAWRPPQSSPDQQPPSDMTLDITNATNAMNLMQEELKKALLDVEVNARWQQALKNSEDV